MVLPVLSGNLVKHKQAKALWGGITMNGLRTLSLLALASNLALPAGAQQNNQQSTRQVAHPATTQTRRPAAGKSETIQYEKLKQPPSELPAMPSYAPAGSKYIMGLKRNVRGVTDILLYIDCAQPPSSALQSYCAQFQQPGWKTLSTTSDSVCAVYGNNTCTVRISACEGKDVKSRIMLDYEFHPNQ